MTYTTYTAAQAATRAKSYTSWRTNRCLNFVRNMIHGTATIGLPDARSAWNKATKKVTTGTPPPGAPVYWQTFSHPYWHIAVSIGGGYVRSTDWPVKGRVGTVSISQMTRSWNMKYLGWSRDLAGRDIRGLEAKTVSTLPAIPAPANYSETTRYVVNDEALRRGVRSTSAKMFNARVWSWLYWHGGTAGRNWCRTNYRAWMAEPSDLFGSMSVSAMRLAYDLMGMDGSKTADWPGPSILTRLGLRAD